MSGSTLKLADVVGANESSLASPLGEWEGE